MHKRPQIPIGKIGRRQSLFNLVASQLWTRRLQREPGYIIFRQLFSCGCICTMLSTVVGHVGSSCAYVERDETSPGEEQCIMPIIIGHGTRKIGLLRTWKTHEGRTNVRVVPFGMLISLNAVESRTAGVNFGRRMERLWVVDVCVTAKFWSDLLDTPPFIPR